MFQFRSKLHQKLLLGKKLNRNWEIGVKLRANGGSPYTPYNVAVSSTVPIWNITSRGTPNYDSVNAYRTKGSYEVDARIDKKYYFRKWDLDLYLDIQNLTGAQAILPPFLNTDLDAGGHPVVDPNSGNPPHYKMHYLKNVYGNVLPSVGIIVDF